MLSLGSPMIFIERPISAVLLVAVLGSVLLPVVASYRRRRRARAAAAAGVLL
jgi:putative tricarboxylic transport membrane protein